MSKLYVFLFTLFLSCVNHGQLKHITDLPQKLSENSGIVHYGDNAAWFIEDNGNSDNLYKVNFKGKFVKQLDVTNAKNHDWEDLTKDKNGNLYIGDFGNNNNQRQNLVIYKLPNPELEKGDKIKAQKIKFYYPEQKNFPPRRGEMFYDAEAFFHYDEHLYIFTKNRANPFNGETFIYKVKDRKGSYKAEFLAKITLCSDWDTCQVTSADISPNGEKIVLLGYGKLWIISDFNGSEVSKFDVKEIDLGVRTQLESVCFKDATTLLLSDEVRDKEGGNLYSYTLKN